MEGIKELKIADYFPSINEEELDSNEERYFLWWLVDLYKAGYVNNVVAQPAPFELGDGMTHDYEKVMATKTKDMTEVVLQPNSYTTDFSVEWTEKAYGIFVVRESYRDRIMHGRKRLIDIGYKRGNNYWSFVEIKGDFDNNNMTRLAIINIKWVWHKYKTFINLHKVPTLFSKTFTPERYIYNNKDGRKRKIKFDVRSLGEFIDSLSE